MSHPRIGRNAASLVVDTRRARQTPRPRNAFSAVLGAGAHALLAGARAATRIVGIPTVSAALSRETAATPAGLAMATGIGGASASSGTQPDLAGTLGAPGMSDDLKLLALQSAIHRQDRQVALVSNVMKARHDTAKTAIANMRS